MHKKILAPLSPHLAHPRKTVVTECADIQWLSITSAHDRHSRATPIHSRRLIQQVLWSRDERRFWCQVPHPKQSDAKRRMQNAVTVFHKRFFFILKQLEGPPSGASNQQDTLK